MRKELEQKYYELFNTSTILKNREKEINDIVLKIEKYKSRYNNLKINIPVYVIGAIHYRESNFNFNKHLHNGDPLTGRTVNKPTGRPKIGNPPFTWEFSALDALSGYKLPNKWNIPNTLYFLEAYNGFGYRYKGINSPYLWAGTNMYERGKYSSDGKYNPNLIDKQIGCAAILKYAITKNLFRFEE